MGFIRVTVALFLLYGLLNSSCSAARSCQMQDWSNKFNKKGETSCASINGLEYSYLVGFERDGTDNLQGVKKAKCCTRDQTFWGVATMCQFPNWIISMDGTGRSWCQQGFFLRGLYRGDSNNIGSVEWGKCCKPSHHPYGWGNCYNEDVSNTFNKAGVSECKREGYFIAGLETTASNGKLSSIKRFKCCKMADSIPQLKTLDELKQQVMDSTMFYIGQLASTMGFAWSGGCWAYYSGDDFERDGDKWVSRYRSPCLGDGPSKDNRLKITYGDFSYTMKDVEFGPSEKQTFSVEDEQYLTSYSRIGRNDKDEPGYSPEVELEVRSARTLVNVQTSTWDSKFGIEVGVAYEPPAATGGAGFSAKTSFEYKWGGSSGESKADEDWHILNIKDTKDLPPNSFSEWNAIKKPEKVTIPYTAKVLPKFSVELEGYMAWGGGYHGNRPNFHQEHRGSGDRKTIKYKFGDANKPFYEDLKEQVEQNVYPWQWHALKQRYSYAQYYIDKLTNPDLYVFTMTGQFEETTEYQVQSTWSPSRPLSELKDAEREIAARQEIQKPPPELPRIHPPPPKVKTVDNSKEMKAPPPQPYISDVSSEVPFNYTEVY